jgi:hypothetical protein
MIRHCCKMMTDLVNHKCDQHPDLFDCPDNLIFFSPASKRYGIIVHDGGSSSITIRYCPWCGAKLPEPPEE